MMNSSKLKAVLIVSLAFNMAVIATVAYGWIQHSKMMRTHAVPEEQKHPSFLDRSHRLAQKLGLDPEREMRFVELLTSSGLEESVCSDHLRAARTELISMLHAEQTDESAVMEKIGEISGYQASLEKILVRRILAARSMLSPKEDARFKELMHCGLKSACDKQCWKPGCQPHEKEDR